MCRSSGGSDGCSKKKEDWVEHADQLSNEAVRQEAEKRKSLCFEKAYNWSCHVNQSINEIPEELKKPFEGVKEGLEYLHQYGDVVVVSSANYDAVKEEWDKYGLSSHVDLILVGREEESWKKVCREGIHQLMRGDFSGDYQEHLLRTFEENLKKPSLT